MSAFRVPTVVLAAGLMIGPMLFAQTAPNIDLPAGDAARGKAIFESSKGNCLSCHRVSGTGSRFGPDLSTIGGRAGRDGWPSSGHRMRQKGCPTGSR